MNHVKLALLINDIFDSVERSKLGNIYLKDNEGNVIKTPEGCPYANIAAVTIMQSIIQAELIKEKINER